MKACRIRVAITLRVMRRRWCWYRSPEAPSARAARRHAERDGYVDARRGFTLIEVVVAGGLVGMLFLVTIPLLGHVRQVRQEADRRMIAQQEAANAMESVAVLAMRSDWSASELDALQLSVAAERLPNAAMEILVGEAGDPLPGLRVTVRVTWTNEAGATAPPAELSAWFSVEGGD